MIQNVLEDPIKIEKRTAEIERNILADNSNIAYCTDLRLWNKFLKDRSLSPNEENLKEYLVYLSQNCKFSTINRRFTSINKVLKIKDTAPLRKMLMGIRNTLAKEGILQEGAAAAQKPAVFAMIDKIDLSSQNQAIKTRNKALLILLYHGCFRISELINLKIEHLRFTDKGLLIKVLNSKTDRIKTGFYKAVFAKQNDKYCPIDLLNKWLIVLNDKTGYIFRSILKSGFIKQEPISRVDAGKIIKSLNPAYSCHSFRVGFITDCSEIGESPINIMNQSAHKSYQMIVHYTRSIDVFKNNAAKNV